MGSSSTTKTFRKINNYCKELFEISQYRNVSPCWLILFNGLLEECFDEGFILGTTLFYDRQKIYNFEFNLTMNIFLLKVLDTRIFGLDECD